MPHSYIYIINYLYIYNYLYCNANIQGKLCLFLFQNKTPYFRSWYLHDSVLISIILFKWDFSGFKSFSMNLFASGKTTSQLPNFFFFLGPTIIFNPHGLKSSSLI